MDSFNPTTKTQAAMTAAMQSASAAGNPEIRPAHLLVALLDQTDGIAAPLLKAVGVDPTVVHREAQTLVDRLPSATGATTTPQLGREAVAALTAAQHLATELDDEYVSTEHADAPLAAVYTSPLSRARETAGPLGAVNGVEPVEVPELMELDFGELEGMPFDRIEAEQPALFRAWMEAPDEIRFPGGESLADLRARVRPAVRALRARHEGQSIAVVAHAGVLRVVLADVLGMDGAAVFRLDQSPGGVSVVDWVGETPVVRVVNGLARA